MFATDAEFHYIKDENLTLEDAFSLEWLETNGLGGYSSSTLANSHTRKYHGLLVARASLPEATKYVLLSKLEDAIIFNDQEFLLSTSQYPNFLQDGGYKSLKEFVCDTHPCFVYQITKDIIVIKEILLLSETNTLFVKYKILAEHDISGAALKIRPLLAYRSFHDLARENNAVQFDTLVCKWGRRSAPYEGFPPLFMQVSEKHDFDEVPLWYRNFEYEVEKSRGFEFTEDLFSPGSFRIGFAKEIIFSASLTEVVEDFWQLWDQEIKRRQDLATSRKGSPLQKQLQIAAKSFLQREAKKNLSIVAGYHWFNAWGRDAMISLPGITLIQKDYKTCFAVLQTYAAHERDGVLPNFLGPTPETTAYNAVDVGLWFAWAVQQYCDSSRDYHLVKKHLWQTLKNIYEGYKNGTMYSIYMSSNGILNAGDEKNNVTWMDAVVNGIPVTPRFGAQVEVNALWFNMLNFMYRLADVYGDIVLKKELKELIPKLKESFLKTFWDENLGYLKDFINNNEQNCALRPNQIFAVSLPYSPLPKAIAKQVLSVVAEQLLTPFGLRTLAKSDPNYLGHYQGGPEARDKAYHNGTVWPWLLGHFGEGLVKIFGRSSARKLLRPCVEALEKHLHYSAGVGTISEIFSGDVPYESNGCISQAWSVAEVLRLTYLLGIK